jgi:hypothetical protein
VEGLFVSEIVNIELRANVHTIVFHQCWVSEPSEFWHKLHKALDVLEMCHITHSHLGRAEASGYNKHISTWLWYIDAFTVCINIDIP